MSEENRFMLGSNVSVEDDFCGGLIFQVQTDSVLVKFDVSRSLLESFLTSERMNVSKYEHPEVADLERRSVRVINKLWARVENLENQKD